MSKKPSKYEGFFAKGARFGEWTIVNPDIRKGVKDHEVLCQCSCGFEGYVSASNIARGKSTRCGECRRKASTKQTGSNNPFWKGVGEIPSGKFRRIKDQATREFLAKLWDECDKHCALTGVPLTMGVDASPDRINSNKGYYVEGNVQWVHKDVNIMKNAFDIDYFIDTCRKIAGKFPAEQNNLKEINMLVVYSQNHCPACVKLKTLLDNYGVAYSEVKLEDDPEAKAFVLSEGHRSVPQLYRDGKMVVANPAVTLSRLAKSQVLELIK